jgi:flagellar biosynthesis/type III secretory pathway M-ring protein FliF/YscJ
MLAIAQILGVDAWVIRAIAAFLAVSVIWWAADTVHDRIYDAGYAAATAVYDKERADAAEADANEQRRQAIANNAAKKREAEALAELERAQTENEELRKELRREAQQDPDAGRIAIGSGGVQRINKVR